jgi:hypothetical protein
MYLKFNKENITGAQLKAIAAILELDDIEDLQWFYNVYYETCRAEIEATVENNINSIENIKIKKDPYYNEMIDLFADDLYETTDNIFEELYNYAEDVLDMSKFLKGLKNKYNIELDE